MVKEGLTFSIHVFSKYISNGRPSVAVVSGLQDRLQEYIRVASHSINKTPRERFSTSVRDWATLQVDSVTAGSFKMECVTNSDIAKSEKLSKACELLVQFSKGEFDINQVRKQIGEEGIFLASLLAEFVSKSSSSMSITWQSESTSGGYLAIDKRRADNFLKAVGYAKKGKNQRKVITIKLTPEEADPLRKPVRGTGGHQSLIKGLQSKLKKDNAIDLTASEIEKIARYGLNYGGGGFQNRLLGIAKALKQVDASLQTSFATGTRSSRIDEY
jgi:hypothetical protein